MGLQEGSDNRTGSLRYRCPDVHTGKQTASLYLAFGGMGLFFIGRLAGGVIMNYIQPRLVLLVCAILTFVATLIVVVCSGTLSLIAFFALYLGESIMFPTIFSLALRDAGTKTKLASSLLIMTIVGGAVAPVIMGYIADTTGSMPIAFLIPLVCYGVIGGYALLKPSLPLKRAPPLTPALSPQKRGRKPPYSAIFAPPVPPQREGPYPMPKP